MKLAVVTCHFNWANFDNPRRNLNRFLRQMDRMNLDTFGIELSFPNREFVTESRGSNWERHRVNHLATLWQKEALLNHATRNLVPAEYDAIAFIDADVEFANPDWVNQAAMALEHHPIIQPFDEANWTDRNGAVCQSRLCVAKHHLDMVEWNTHPGFAWVMRRDFFEKIGGWYDIAPLGSGDVALAFALEKAYPGDYSFHKLCRAIGHANVPAFEDWKDGVQSAMRGQTVGWVNGDVYHEWHGDAKNRNYVNREQYLKSYFAERDLKRHKNGYFTWTRKANPEMVQAMKDYFTQRDEDGANEK